MADLLHSLIPSKYEIAHHNNSQDSFYSAGEEALEATPISQQKVQRVLQEQINPSMATNVADRTSHQIYDINTYLSESSNVALLDSIVSKPQTGHHVSLLYQACQAKGLTPTFDIEGEACSAVFKGALKVGDVTVTLDEFCHSKKEARDRLAEKAIELVQAIPVTKTTYSTTLSATDQDGKDRNWVGMLQEYHNQTPYHPTQSLRYTAHSPALHSHACTLHLPSHPTLTFGSATHPHPTKKLAQRSAAQQAIAHLISTGQLDPDGRVIKPARKPTKPSPSPSSSSPAPNTNNNNSTTTPPTGGVALPPPPTRALTLHPPPTDPTSPFKFTLSHPAQASKMQLVAELAPLLDLPAPVYRLSPSSPHAPSLLSGWVEFPGGGEGLQRVGEVRNVFGKRAAREEMAGGAWVVLLGVVGGRGGRVVVEGE